jgi:MOSC domain-containing protein YiiM
MTIIVEGIYCSSVASGPMTSLQTGTLLKGVGLKGDRYAQRKGSYSVFRASQQAPGEQEPGRQLTLVSADGIEEAFRRTSTDGLVINNSLSSTGDLRRNIGLRGISAENLLNAVGSIIQLGDKGGARVLVHRNCVPCMYNQKKNCIPGMMEALWDAGGVSCEVIDGGDISVGDVASIHANQEGYLVDPGKQSLGFFVRPSERSAEMVRDALESKKRLYNELVEVDNEGVQRAQQSCESVGLSFWPKSAKSNRTL